MALQFIANGGIYSGYPSTSLPAAQGDQTLMCWINSAAFGTGNTNSMCGFYNGTYNASTAPTTASQIGTRIGTSFDVWTWGGSVMISSTGITPVNGTWYHIAYVYKVATTTHQLYVNGVLNNTAVNAIQQAGTFTQLYLNGYPQLGSANAETGNTALDGIRGYNRALTGPEILTIYNSGGLRDGIVYGQCAHYLMNGVYGGQSGTLYDVSGLNSTMNLYATTTNTCTYITGPVNSLSRPLH